MNLIELASSCGGEELPDVVDIGRWSPYASWANESQIDLQKEFLFDTGLHNGQGSVKFILTKQLQKLEVLLKELSKQVPIEETSLAIVDEVFYTTKIEGATTTRLRTSQIHEGKELDENNYKSERMVLNSFRATKKLNLYGNRISKEVLIDVWNTLTEDVCENERIRGSRFRIGDVRVGSFIPVTYTLLEDLMGQFCEFYNSTKLNKYPFIKAAIIHFVFETIHPFCDGNGRLGRMLMNNYLINIGIESAKAVSFSMAIDSDRPHYDVAFIDAENVMCDCTPFLEFMLQRMYSAYDNICNSNKN